MALKDKIKKIAGMFGIKIEGGASISEVIKQAEEAGMSEEEIQEIKDQYEKAKEKSAKEFSRGGVVKKANGGMMNKGTKVRGQGAAIRGTKFKGVF
jgi:hypothetical protein